MVTGDALRTGWDLQHLVATSLYLIRPHAAVITVAIHVLVGSVVLNLRTTQKL